MEFKSHVFQINDNRKVLFDTPTVPNMIAMSLTIKKIEAMLKFFESRSKGHNQNLCLDKKDILALYESPMSYCKKIL